MLTIHSLPAEILHLIQDKLDYISHLSFSRTARHFRQYYVPRPRPDTTTWLELNNCLAARYLICLGGAAAGYQGTCLACLNKYAFEVFFSSQFTKLLEVHKRCKLSTCCQTSPGDECGECAWIYAATQVPYSFLCKECRMRMSNLNA